MPDRHHSAADGIRGNDQRQPAFQRHARGVELTSAGEIFLRHARSSLRQTERVRSELDALKGLRRGTINLQAIESLVPGVLPQAILRFSARHPGITFEVTVRPPTAPSRRCSRCANRWSR